MVHVVAGAVGVSALLMASAQAFLILKLAGGVCLIYLGVQTWRSAGALADLRACEGRLDPWIAFRQSAMVEATNPKTAAFLALLPQFIDPTRGVAGQFLVLGAVSVALDTMTGVLVVRVVAVLRKRVLGRSVLIARLRRSSGLLLGGLGVWLLFTRKPA